MYLNDNKISVSLATITMEAIGSSTKLSVTEMGVFLDGYDTPEQREQGTNYLLDTLVKSLA
jgi:hypothetical protein